ncbi:MAG: UDP-N-acetylmuramoyl-L-alanine--D-glutamate ligase [Patescibacteria group bacterium]|jgi:UDP-N-acetylmuramoylalanine--D-glutamate ligase
MEVFRSAKLAQLPGIQFGTAARGFLPLTFRANPRQKVLAQRRAFGKAVGIVVDRLVLGRQVHGQRVRIVTDHDIGAGVLAPKTYLPATDGLLTQRPNIALGVFTADCIPVFLAEPETGWVGLLHVGWKGAVKNIAAEVIMLLKRQGVKPKKVRVWLGPSICGRCYEVTNKKRLQIIRKALRGSVQPTARGGLVDLRAGVVRQLVAMGVRKANIDTKAPCTHETSALPSFRRDGETKTNTLSIISRTSVPTDLRGRKVAVFGLGVQGGGEASVRYAVANHAQVSVVDARPRKDFTQVLLNLRGLPVQYAFGKKNPSALLANAEVIIKNPGVRPDHPALRAARKKGALIIGDLGLFRSHSQNPVYVVTGTKGKTTTASMLAHILRRHLPKTVLAGNVGVSPLAFPQAFDGRTRVVLEVSSFQLEDTQAMPLAPRIGIVTSLFPDHLNRYGSMRPYLAAKQLITRGQTKKDFLLLPLDNPAAQQFAKQTRARVLWFAAKPQARAHAWLDRGWIMVKLGARVERLVAVRKLAVAHPAFWQNAMIAALAARALGIAPATIAKSLQTFPGVPERFQTVRQHRGVTWINDTTATNPEAAAMSIRSAFPKKCVVIAGGTDKHFPLQPLIRALNASAKFVVLLPGSATQKMLPALRVRHQLVNSMPRAVREAQKHAQSGDIVLLSPGAASFGLFRNEFDRGAQFVKAVRTLV